MRYRDVARKLRKLGCLETPRRSGGSHRKWHNPATGGNGTIPDRGSRDLKFGTIRGALRQPGVSPEAFEQA